MSCTESYRYIRVVLANLFWARPGFRRATGPSDVVLFAKTATRQPFRFTSAVDAVLLCPTLTIVHGRSLT
jgi:hypothetical protein